MRVITLTHSWPEYAALLGQVRADPDLVAAMWADAESRPDELALDGTWWTIALDGEVPAAWCAATAQPDGTLKCHSNYERRGYRDRGMYEAAYHVRHRDVVAAHGRWAVTYLFAQPIALHEADGWLKTDLTGTSRDGHEWWELVRPPSRAAQILT